ncbi:hypothetical protein GCM10025862_28530 [Arsenicicoccus piscis]|uniref:Uncharacterized protein n=1 Tax=Arsenicicoccus piscis TaxID=673954 RepID=A0ABQ6HR54_9MICO|nr:hypothetical protein GCM10025862_28530 [Arsenicicoccus piscis]
MPSVSTSLVTLASLVWLASLASLPVGMRPSIRRSAPSGGGARGEMVVGDADGVDTALRH